MRCLVQQRIHAPRQSMEASEELHFFILMSKRTLDLAVLAHAVRTWNLDMFSATLGCVGVPLLCGWPRHSQSAPVIYLFDKHVETRTDRPLTLAEFNTVAAAGKNCSPFASHSSICAASWLYDSGEADVITNLDGLALPFEMNSRKLRGVLTCYGSFSRSDMEP